MEGFEPASLECRMQCLGQKREIMATQFPRLVLAIPQMPPGESLHPGGQLTAANGLVAHLNKKNIDFIIQNTIATAYPRVPLWKKILQATNRVTKVLFMQIDRQPKCYLAFSGCGLSMYERCFTALIFRIFGYPSSLFLRSDEYLRWPAGGWRSRLFRIAIRAPSKLIVQGRGLADYLKGFVGKDVCVIHNWLPDGTFVRSSACNYPLDGKVEFLFVGWLEPEKGVIEILAAAKCLSQKKMKFRVTFIGAGSLTEKVNDFIVENQDTPIRALGWCSRTEVQKQMLSSHVFLLPSHGEGFPNSLLEAMANGLPAITTDVGAISDSISSGKNGLIIKKGDTEQLAHAMSRFIENVEMIKEFSDETLAVVRQQHSRDVNCSKILDLMSC
jgi:glycosyltransferase involved in cell wall biosynthesis